MKKYFCLSVLVVLILFVFCPVIGIAAEKEMTPLKVPLVSGIQALKVGDKAPVFEVLDLDGGSFDFSKVIGEKVYYFVFWSIFCEPCKAEMPIIQKLYEDYKTKGFEVLSVVMDGKEDFFEYDGRAYIAKDKLTFKILFDELDEEEMFEIADSYGVAGTPTSIIVDKKGKVAFVKVGVVTYEEIKKVIEPLLSVKE